MLAWPVLLPRLQVTDACGVVEIRTSNLLTTGCSLLQTTTRLEPGMPQVKAQT